MPLSRRDAVAALVGGTTGAAAASAVSAARIEDAGPAPQVAVADRWLRAWAGGDVERRRGTVVALGPGETAGARWRYEGLPAGRYLLSADGRRLDAVVAVPVEAGGLGDATLVRFTFDDPQSPTLAAVVVGDSAPTLIHRALSAREMADPRAVQRVYDQLAASGGGTMAFPAGRHAINLKMTSRRVGLVGAGMTATTLVAADRSQPVLQALYNSGGWEPVSIAELGLSGRGGTGFMAGQIPRGPDDEFSGRTLMRGVRFEGFDTALHRPHGQIGLWLEHCVFEGGQVHLAATHQPTQDGEPMHAGNCVARDCHFQGAQRAVVTLDSAVTGTGQITFDHCLFENNPGFVLFVTSMNGLDGVPALLLKSCWNENNATAPVVDIGGRRLKPVFGDFTDAAMVRFEDTPPGPLRLRNSVVATRDCALDRLTSIERDSRSTVRHSEARAFGSMVPKGTAASVAAAFQFGPNRAPSFAMPPRTGTRTGSGLRVLMAAPENAGFTLAGNRPAPSRPVAGEQRVELGGGDRLHLTPLSAVDPGWIAWLFDYRLVAGTAPAFQVGGGSGLSTSVPLDADVRTCLAGLSAVDARLTDIGLLVNADADATLALFGANLVWFATRQDALDFVNAGRFAS